MLVPAAEEGGLSRVGGDHLPLKIDDHPGAEPELNALASLTFRNMSALALPAMVAFQKTHKRFISATEKQAWVLTGKWRHLLTIFEAFHAALEKLTIKLQDQKNSSVKTDCRVIPTGFQKEIFALFAEFFDLQNKTRLLKSEFLRVQQLFNTIVNPWKVHDKPLPISASMSRKLTHIFNAYVSREKADCTLLKDRINERLQQIQQLEGTLEEIKGKMDTAMRSALPVSLEAKLTDPSQAALTAKFVTITQKADLARERLNDANGFFKTTKALFLQLCEVNEQAKRLKSMPSLNDEQRNEARLLCDEMNEKAQQARVAQFTIHCDSLKEWLTWAQETYSSEKREKDNAAMVAAGVATTGDIEIEKEVAQEVLINAQIIYTNLTKLRTIFEGVLRECGELRVQLNGCMGIEQPHFALQVEVAQVSAATSGLWYYLSFISPSAWRGSTRAERPLVSGSSKAYLADLPPLALPFLKGQEPEEVSLALFSRARWDKVLAPPEKLVLLYQQGADKIVEGPIKHWLQFHQAVDKNGLQALYALIEDFMKSFHAPCLTIYAEFMNLKAMAAAPYIKGDPIAKQLYENALHQLNQKIIALGRTYVTHKGKIDDEHKILTMVCIYLSTSSVKFSRADSDESAVQKEAQQNFELVNKAHLNLKSIRDNLLGETVQNDRKLIDEMSAWMTNNKGVLNVEQDWMARLDPAIQQARQEPKKVKKIAQEYQSVESLLLANKIIEPKQNQFEFRVFRHFYQMSAPDSNVFENWEQIFSEREHTNFRILRECFIQQAVDLTSALSRYQNLAVEFSIFDWMCKQVMKLDADEPYQSAQREEDWKLLKERYEALGSDRQYWMHSYHALQKWLEAVVLSYNNKLKKFSDEVDPNQAVVKTAEYEEKRGLIMKTPKGLEALETHIKEAIAFFEHHKAMLKQIYENQLLPLSKSAVATINAIRYVQDGTARDSAAWYNPLSVNPKFIGDYFAEPLSADVPVMNPEPADPNDIPI